MNPLAISKAVVAAIVSTGAGAVVGNAIKQSTPTDLVVYKKIAIGVGGFVLSAAAGQQASKYVSEQIDSTLTQIQELKDRFTKKN